MHRVNLLPWRDARRRQREKAFLGTLGLCAAAAGLLLIAGQFAIGQQIDTQRTRNDLLQSEIDALNTQIQEIRELQAKKDALIARMNVIQELQIQRPQAVHLFDSLVRNVPEGMTLAEMTQRDKRIRMRGIAQSNARVSDFLNALDQSRRMANAQLDVIRNSERDGQRISNFSIQVDQIFAPPAPPPIEDPALAAHVGQVAER